MERVNSSTQVVQSQIPVAEFVQIWLDKHVSTLGAAARAKYRTQVRHHLLPDFGELRLCDLGTEIFQEWLNGKRLSWWSKNGLRVMMSSLFSKAIDWGYWQERNPVERVTAGKKRPKRRQRLLSDEEAESLVARLPEVLKLIIALIRTTGCRISEILGLQWRHIDLATGWVSIEQRWYRGDLDVVKSERGERELPLGNLVERLRELPRGGDDAYIFRPRRRAAVG